MAPFDTYRVVCSRTGQLGKRQVMNPQDCDVIFDDNQSINLQGVLDGREEGVLHHPQNMRDISGPSSTPKSEVPPRVFRVFCLGSEALSVPASGREAVAVRRPRVGHALGETQTLNP